METYEVLIAVVSAAVILREWEPRIADCGDRVAELPASLMSRRMSSEEAERAAD